MDRSLRQSKLQVPVFSCVWWRLHASDTLQDSTDDSNIDKVETSFWTTGAFLSVLRYDWCTPLAHLSSCMLVNHWPLQQSCKEYEPQKWGVYWKILHISYRVHVIKEEVCSKIKQAIGPHEDLTMAERHKLKWYEQVSCPSDLAKIILQGTVKGGRRQGRQK